ncbi:Uncharacterised protein [Yersinia frederiksenii]|uniref:Uncharacterized protein n=2 Tax=Yersinia frederiksenii TaxID=29484 RepID=A0A380PNW5_YERFR|nr:putative membrane protein [Yersinia frederiksenii ATCC 33641]CFQ85839.1 Uncharacterised protein [Yersinia frederiksenii]CNC41470.1 Uncharacterised protein [Yersinia frederiksenii]CNF17573.1 Uncharacterised protein [Yersinia frederiksenii]SUP75258.1 Uncharacterised protein [Yersinia frederiksenii]
MISNIFLYSLFIIYITAAVVDGSLPLFDLI